MTRRRRTRLVAALGSAMAIVTGVFATSASGADLTVSQTIPFPHLSVTGGVCLDVLAEPGEPPPCVTPGQILPRNTTITLTVHGNRQTTTEPSLFSRTHKDDGTQVTCSDGTPGTQYVFRSGGSRSDLVVEITGTGAFEGRLPGRVVDLHDERPSQDRALITVCFVEIDAGFGN